MMKDYPVKNIIVLVLQCWLMTAILCKTFLKNLNVNVKIIQSGKAPILGVGEGTTEHIQEFIKHSGIDEDEFVRETKATMKVGVLFKDWLHEGHEYLHSLLSYHTEDTPCNVSPHHNMSMPIGGYACFINPEIDRREELSGFVRGKTYQYHFNNFALNDYLRKKCLEFDIEIIDDYITDVEIDENSNIKSIKGEQNHKADFFFDCSGFKRLLISKFNPEFVDYSEQLIVDRALFFPYKTVDNPIL